MMTLDIQHRPILMTSLISYINEPEEYNISDRLIVSSEFDELTSFSPDIAEDILKQLNSGNFLIGDQYLDGIMCITLGYKDIINDLLIDSDDTSQETIDLLKTERKALNALIRFLKNYMQG